MTELAFLGALSQSFLSLVSRFIERWYLIYHTEIYKTALIFHSPFFIFDLMHWSTGELIGLIMPNLVQHKNQ